jgi:hypothetical protein
MENSISPNEYNEVFEKAKEDTIESFFACLFQVISVEVEKETNFDLSACAGVAYGVCHRLYGYLMDMTFRRVGFDALKYEDVFDPITRYKETIERKAGGSVYWPLGKSVKLTTFATNISGKETPVFYRARVWVWNKQRPEENEEPSRMIAEVFDTTEDAAKRKACLEALKFIKTDPELQKLGLREKKKSYDAPNVSKITSREHDSSSKNKNKKNKSARSAIFSSEGYRELLNLKKAREWSLKDFQKASSEMFAIISKNAK